MKSSKTEENLWAMRKSETNKLPRNILSHKGHYVFILSSVLLIIMLLCRFHLFTILYARWWFGKRTSVLIFGRQTWGKKTVRRCEKTFFLVLVLIIEWNIFVMSVICFFAAMDILWVNNNTSSRGWEQQNTRFVLSMCEKGAYINTDSACLFNFMSQNFVYVVSHFCGNEKSKRRGRIFHHNPSIIS